MSLSARLKPGETMGDRVMKVDHAGEHGAICIYRAQRFFARWTAPEMVAELDEFLTHERRHRNRFGAELSRRGRGRCRSYFFCGLGGFMLGSATGIAGRGAIAATTVAIERVVLRHMQEQLETLASTDKAAAAALRDVIADEQSHHDLSAARIPNGGGLWAKVIDPVVAASTEAVIWLGMRL
ncbi:MAG TPA: demethoxyubiquinone hydroxylase family protein [Allosphingosinicella sp.]|jgi:ubiquinone biosynthesis monooxygenase Coq7